MSINTRNREIKRNNKKNNENQKLLELTPSIQDKILAILLQEKIIDEESFDDWI